MQKTVYRVVAMLVAVLVAEYLPCCLRVIECFDGVAAALASGEAINQPF